MTELQVILSLNSSHNMIIKSDLLVIWDAIYDQQCGKPQQAHLLQLTIYGFPTGFCFRVKISLNKNAVI